MTPKQMKSHLQEAFKNIFETPNAKEETIAKYFSKDYHQAVDGNKLDYPDFVKHIEAQQAAIKSAKFTFEHLVAEGNKLCSIHHIDAIKKDGGRVAGQVNALFQFKDGKIVSCNELTMLTFGTEEDKDLGSRT